MELILLLIILGGIMNGSFAIPIHYLKTMTIESVWFFHSIIGLFLISWLLFFIMMPSQFSHYRSLSLLSLLWMLGGGFIFGLGQLCFARAISSIGIALSFSINLGLSVVIGSLYTISLKKSLLTSHSAFVVLSILLILIGLIYYYLSVRHKSRLQHTNMLKRGCLLAVFAGVASGLQNIAFVVVSFHSTSDFPTQTSYWFWPPFFSIAAMVMLIGFKKQISVRVKLPTAPSSHGILLIIVMGLLFTGSIACYSFAMSHTTHVGKIVGWPLFMVSIILTSQFWGVKFREFNFENKRTRWRVFMSIGSMLLAILILACQK